MGWLELLFGPNGWAPLLLKGALITVMLAVTSAPFGFGAGLALALLKLRDPAATLAPELRATPVAAGGMIEAR